MLTGRARDVLTHAEAAGRAARVGRADYDISLELAAGVATYHGDVSISFALSSEGEDPLFLDFRGRTIELLEVNGHAAEPEWTGYRLTLPAELLRDDNVVHVRYVNDYDTTGDGFHRFVDPEDGAEYVYTNFEPYEAHRLFPCFDQPDIKGRYKVTVVAPEAWQVVANAPLAKSGPADAGRTRHQFAQTELFSTYLMALIGGPYAVRRTEHKGLRLGLYARRSMEHLLEEQAPEIFEITGQGLDFYAEQFDQPYPFAKYDQVFVPEYNSGAMENVGCVTYNEAHLFRDPPTNNQRLNRAETFLHELAHMWFGNLVTMRWWNDLWLNESFATYVSYVTMVEATRFTNAWKVFAADIKRWAYQQDQLPTTHPISGEAPDTEIAFLNFDGITYGKGASVLKQLVKYIGRDAFREGMRLYFRRHAWANATLGDFLACLEEASGQRLDEWARLWLETASLNTLAAGWRPDGERLAELTVHQSAPEAFPYLRPHAIEVTLGRDAPSGLEIAALPVWVNGAETTVAAAEGRPLPELVFPNHGDHTYAKVQLDAASLGFVRRNLARVDDALLRELLWMSLWEMVRDRQLRSTAYLAIGRELLSTEPDLDITNTVLDRAALSIARYVPEGAREQQAHSWFEFALVNVAASNGDRRIIWARSAIQVAASSADVARLADLVTGREKIGDLEFDQEMRWAIAVKAVAFGLPHAEETLEREAARDRSDRGHRALLRAQSSRPTAEAKAEAWQKIHGAGYGSFHLTRAAMMGFFWPQQEEIVEPYADQFFDKVREVFATRDHPFARSYLMAMYPAYRGDPEVLERSLQLLTDLDGSLPTLKRQLIEVADELDRQIKVRAYAEASR
jgi:aminopeptidase N